MPVLQALGFAEYIFGPYKLSSFDFVRRVLKKAPQSEPCLVYTRLPTGAVHHVPVLREINHHDSTVAQLAQECTLANQLQTPLRVRIRGIRGVLSNCPAMCRITGRKDGCTSDPSVVSLCVSVGLFHGERLAPGCPMVQTSFVSPNIAMDGSMISFNEWISLSIHISQVPPTARLCFTVWGVLKKKEASLFTKWVDPQTGELLKESAPCAPIGWVNVQLVDHRGLMKTGTTGLKLWPNDSSNPIATCVENAVDPMASVLFLQYDSYPQRVLFKLPNLGSRQDLPGEQEQPLASPATTKKPVAVLRNSPELERVVGRDPLYELSEEEKGLIWLNRHVLQSNPVALPKFLQSFSPVSAAALLEEAHQLLWTWQQPTPLNALELLDSKYADSEVRAVAVRCLESLSDRELTDFLLQLTQVLKYEPHHDSPLARFLVRRALANPDEVGHYFFWHLKAEMHVAAICERYGLILEEYLRFAGSVRRRDLMRQHEVVKKLCAVADAVKLVPKNERLALLHAELRKLELPERFRLPLDPRMECRGLRIEKCKTMDSKKVPLWLVFENADPQGAPIVVMFKAGDDLRQDLLTLQMLRIMDKMWQAEGLDNAMNAYGCVATGDQEGMIEIVLNSETSANITRTVGGGASAAFRKDTFEIWLRQHNPTDDAYAKAVHTFSISTAAYCVATYVLGIGDRHNDNIMVTKTGALFHIDFGHFLGNIKKKFGVKRERAPFVFTPDFAHVMGGEGAAKYREFEDLCCRLYNIVRRNANFFINLFALMLSTGIPELQRKSDIDYLRTALQLDLSEEEASRYFKGLIKESLNSRATQLNNYIHILAH